MFDYRMHNRIQQWMIEAAEKLRQSLKRDLEVEQKTSASDLVTEMDKKTEAYFVEKIRRYYPDSRILGEEGSGDVIEDVSGTLWIIDPIDGTLNFVKQKNHFAIMIGIFQDGEPMAGYIYDVMNYNLYYGIVGDGVYVNQKPLIPNEITTLDNEMIVGNTNNFIYNRLNARALSEHCLGVRTYGSAAIEIISVLNGEVALYFSTRLNPWDFGAGYAIFETLGYKVTNHKGEPLNILKKSPVLFAHPNVYDDAIKLLNQTK